MTEKKKNIAEQAIENVVDKPKSAENAEGSVTTHPIKDLIALDEHLAKKEAGAHMKAPYGIKSSICVPGKSYG